MNIEEVTWVISSQPMLHGRRKTQKRWNAFSPLLSRMLALHSSCKVSAQINWKCLSKVILEIRTFDQKDRCFQWKMDQFAECLRYAVTKCCRGRHETRAYRCKHLWSSRSGDFYTQSVLHNLTGFSRFSSPRDFQGQDHIRLPQAAGCRDIKCWYKNPLLGTPERILNISGHTEEMLTPYIFLLQTRNSTNSRVCCTLLTFREIGQIGIRNGLECCLLRTFKYFVLMVAEKKIWDLRFWSFKIHTHFLSLHSSSKRINMGKQIPLVTDQYCRSCC